MSSWVAFSLFIFRSLAAVSRLFLMLVWFRERRLALERQHDLLLFERLAITEQEYVDRQVIYLFSECLASGLGATEFSSLVQVIAAGESKGFRN